jgi:hypothetical protein
MKRINTSLTAAPTITTKPAYAFEVTFSLEYFVQTYGPLGRSYTFEVEENGQRYVFSGLEPIVNDDPRGTTVSFRSK